VINVLSSYTVFDRGSVYSQEAAGYGALKLAVHENQKHLNEQVRKIICGFGKSDLIKALGVK